MRRIFLAALLAAALPWAALAQTANQPFYPKILDPPYAAQISNANGTSIVTFATPSSTVGTLILSISCTSTEPTLGHALNVYRVHSSTDYLLAQVWIPALSGDSASATAMIPPVQIVTNTNLPGNMDSYGNRTIPLASGDTIGISVTAAVTNGDFIECTGLGWGY